jgi:hypothetical protein
VTAFAELVRSAVTGDAKKTLMTSFKEFIEALPKKVDFSENGASRQKAPGSGGVQEEINTKVSALRKTDTKLSYKDALDLVFAEDPDLKTRYVEENR